MLLDDTIFLEIAVNPPTNNLIIGLDKAIFRRWKSKVTSLSNINFFGFKFQILM